MDIAPDLVDEVIETLERSGCAGGYCDGPTLEPVDMKTCYACETLAKLRVAAGRPPRTADELTWEESYWLEDARRLASATGRAVRDILHDRGYGHLTTNL